MDGRGIIANVSLAYMQACSIANRSHATVRNDIVLSPFLLLEAHMESLEGDKGRARAPIRVEDAK